LQKKIPWHLRQGKESIKESTEIIYLATSAGIVQVKIAT
jgi:hypothetical protein